MAIPILASFSAVIILAIILWISTRSSRRMNYESGAGSNAIKKAWFSGKKLYRGIRGRIKSEKRLERQAIKDGGGDKLTIDIGRAESKGLKSEGGAAKVELHETAEAAAIMQAGRSLMESSGLEVSAETYMVKLAEELVRLEDEIIRAADKWELSKRFDEFSRRMGETVLSIFNSGLEEIRNSRKGFEEAERMIRVARSSSEMSRICLGKMNDDLLKWINMQAKTRKLMKKMARAGLDEMRKMDNYKLDTPTNNMDQVRIAYEEKRRKITEISNYLAKMENAQGIVQKFIVSEYNRVRKLSAEIKEIDDALKGLTSDEMHWVKRYEHAHKFVVKWNQSVGATNFVTGINVIVDDQKARGVNAIRILNWIRNIKRELLKLEQEALLPLNDRMKDVPNKLFLVQQISDTVLKGIKQIEGMHEQAMEGLEKLDLSKNIDEALSREVAIVKLDSFDDSGIERAEKNADLVSLQELERTKSSISEHIKLISIQIEWLGNASQKLQSIISLLSAPSQQAIAA